MNCKQYSITALHILGVLILQWRMETRNTMALSTVPMSQESTIADLDGSKEGRTTEGLATVPATTTPIIATTNTPIIAISAMSTYTTICPTQPTLQVLRPRQPSFQPRLPTVHVQVVRFESPFFN